MDAEERIRNAYPELPAHIIKEIVQAFNYPGTAGGFYTAILENDLAKAACAADLEHRKYLGQIALIFHRDKPDYEPDGSEFGYWPGEDAKPHPAEGKF